MGDQRATAWLAGLRIAFGAAALAAPDVLERAALLRVGSASVGADTTGARRAAWAFFGTRACVLGAARLAARDDPSSRQVVDDVCLGVDAADTAALAALAASGRLPRAPAGWLGAVCAAFTAIGAWTRLDR